MVRQRFLRHEPLLLVLFLTQCPYPARSATLEGRVLCGDFPASYALLRLHSAGADPQEQAADALGRFRFDDLAPGNYRLEAAFLSQFDTLQISGLEAGRTHSTTLLLKPLGFPLQRKRQAADSPGTAAYYRGEVARFGPSLADYTPWHHFLEAELEPIAVQSGERRRLSDPALPSEWISAAERPISGATWYDPAAGYAAIRKFADRFGMLPPPAAVRPEAFLNAFEYSYPKPAGESLFAFQADVLPCPWNPQNLLLRVGIQARETRVPEPPPANLVFLVDVSSSMAHPGRLPLFRQGFEEMLQMLRPQDRVAIVVYAGGSGVVLPGATGDELPRIRASIRSLRTGGRTAGAQGILHAYREAERNFCPGGRNQVILATDGDFNVGLTHNGALSQYVAQRRKTGISLSVVGLTPKPEAEARMQRLAEAGGGTYYPLEGAPQARRVFRQVLLAGPGLLAREARTLLQFHPKYVRTYRLIGYEQPPWASENGQGQALGDVWAGQSLTLLYEITPAQCSETVPKWRNGPAAMDEAGLSDALQWFRLQIRYRFPEASHPVFQPFRPALPLQPAEFPSPDARWAAAVAFCARLLRQPEASSAEDWDCAWQYAQRALPPDPGREHYAFLQMLAAYRHLAKENLAGR